MSSSNYRPDIDGLRAIAVGSVVINHAFPDLLPGGFIGVDIFFVISGYLITGILLNQIEQGRFSILDFYEKRIRRIFPALVTVLFACLAAGWWLMFVDEFEHLGKHVAGGAGFVSNFVLWREGGYFDLSSEEKPLLHLWSLAVEEQFYLLWPLMLAFVRRRRSLLLVMAVVGVLSFWANMWLLRGYASAAFFMPLPRFWELMVGGVLAYVTLYRSPWLEPHRDLRSLLGLALLLLGLASINKSVAFPGWRALMPTMGVFLMISAGPHAWVNKRLLSLPIMTGLGRISYPVYLWHWPLLSFAYVVEGPTSYRVKTVLVAASVLLAWATYRWIENPLRFSRWRMMSPVLLGGLAVAGLAGFSIVLANGYENTGARDAARMAVKQYFENELPAWHYFEREGISAKYNQKCNFYDIDAYRHGRNTRIPISAIDASCYTRDAVKTKTLLIWGDSHAQQFYHGLSMNLPAEWQILQVASSGCAPDITVDHDSTNNYCFRSNWFALKTIREIKPDIVIIGQAANHQRAVMEATDKALKALGARAVLFAGPAVRWSQKLPNNLLRHLWGDKPRRTWIGVDQDIFQLDRTLARDFKPEGSSRYVSLFDYFCEGQGCLTYIGNELPAGMVSWDHGHLTPIASDAFARDVLAPLLLDIYKDLDQIDGAV